MKNIRAVLFDMDGLLLDSEEPNMRWCKVAANQMGFDVDIPTLARKVCGTRRAQAIEAYARALPEWVDAEAFYQLKTDLMLAERAVKPLQLKKGAKELLTWLKEHGIISVLATSTTRESAEATLRRLEIWDLLPYQVTGGDVTIGKPDPEVYVKAAALAGIPVEECLVMEDAFNGLCAGRASGAMVAMVPDMMPYTEECAPYCDIVFTDLLEAVDWFEKD